MLFRKNCKKSELIGDLENGVCLHLHGQKSISPFLPCLNQRVEHLFLYCDFFLNFDLLYFENTSIIYQICPCHGKYQNMLKKGADFAKFEHGSFQGGIIEFT